MNQLDQRMIMMVSINNIHFEDNVIVEENKGLEAAKGFQFSSSNFTTKVTDCCILIYRYI